MTQLNYDSFAGGRYTVLKKLGEGGKGIVYRCMDSSLDRMVALKLIKTTLDEETGARFQREAKTTAKLSHPNIVSIYDMGTQDGHPFLVIEYIEGKSLEDIIRDQGALSPSEILRISKDIASALEYAHKAGVLHRDVKPDNIMISKSGMPKLMDFGLARSLDSPKLTHAGAIVGTPAYVSPESALGRKNDGRSDLYSLGCVMYCMATGHPPFVSDDNLKLIYSHINDIPKPISQNRKDFPQSLETVIMKLMSKDPNKRPSSASELLNILSNLDYGTEELEGLEKEKSTVTPDPVGPVRSISGRNLRPLVGREDQIRTIRSQIDAIISGSGSVVLIVGKRGTGKSRLIEEASAYSSMRSITVIGVKCNETKSLVPGQALTDLFKEYFTDKPMQLVYKICGDYADELAKLLPELAPKLGKVPDIAGLSPEQQTNRFYEGVSTFLENMSTEEPILVSVDDAQYLDRISLNFLRYYNEFVSGSRICIMASSTPFEENSEMLKTVSEAVRSHTLEMMEIDNLNREQTAQMIANFLGENVSTITADFLNLIYGKTSGNPLFLEETLKYLIDRKQIYQKEDGSWNRESLSDLKLPSSVRNIIRERLSSLDEKSLNVLRIASVVGNEFDYDVLREMTGGEDEEAFLDLVEDLIKNKFLNEKRSGPGQVRLVFTDSQTKDILYDDISMIRRGRYHQKAGMIIEKVSANRPMDRYTISSLSRHFMEGRNLPKALEYYTKQADMWTESLDYSEAVKTLETCIDIVRELNDGTPAEEKLSMEGEIHTKIAKCTSAFDSARSAHHAELAKEIFQKTGNNAALIEVLTGLVGDSTEPDKYYELVKSLPDEESTIEKKVNFYYGYATSISLFQGRKEEAISILKECLDTAKEHNMKSLLLRLNFAFYAFTPIKSEADKNYIFEKFDETYEMAKAEAPLKLLTQENVMGTVVPEVVADFQASNYFFVKCDIRKCKEELDKAEEHTSRRKWKSYLDVIEAERNYMVTLHESGAEAALRFSQEKLAEYSKYKAQSAIQHIIVYLSAAEAWYHSVNGNEEEALSSLSVVKMMRGEQYKILYHLPLVQMYTDSGKLKEAGHETDIALESIRGKSLGMENTSYFVFMNTFNGEIGYLSGNSERIDNSISSLRKLEKILNERWVTACKLRIESHKLMMESDHEAAAEKLEESSRVWGDLGMKFWKAKDLLSLASAYRDAGNSERASDAINRSIELFTAANASFYVEKALAMKELLKA